MSFLYSSYYFLILVVCKRMEFNIISFIYCATIAIVTITRLFSVIYPAWLIGRLIEFGIVIDRISHLNSKIYKDSRVFKVFKLTKIKMTLVLWVKMLCQCGFRLHIVLLRSLNMDQNQEHTCRCCL